MLIKRSRQGSIPVILLSTAIAIACTAGMLIVGTPQSARAKKIDDATLIAISETARYLTCYYSANDEFPESLEALSGWVADPPYSLRDQGPSYACDSVYSGSEWPATKLLEYRMETPTRFELCADFIRASDGSRLRYYQTRNTSLTDLDEKRLGSGRHCYSGTASAVRASERPGCETIDECISLLKTHEVDLDSDPKGEHRSSFTLGPLDVAQGFLRRQGDEAVSALVPLLEDPNHDIHNRAAYILGQFNEIDGRHLEHLITAHQGGIGWLEPSIGRTGREEALDYLWRDFLDYSSTHSKNNTMTGLGTFFDQLKPKIESEITKCLAMPDEEICFGLVMLSERGFPFPDAAIPMFELLLTRPSLTEHQRFQTESQLAGLRGGLAD